MYIYCNKFKFARTCSCFCTSFKNLSLVLEWSIFISLWWRISSEQESSDFLGKEKAVPSICTTWDRNVMFSYLPRRWSSWVLISNARNLRCCNPEHWESSRLRKLVYQSQICNQHAQAQVRKVINNIGASKRPAKILENWTITERAFIRQENSLRPYATLYLCTVSHKQWKTILLES